MSKVIKGILIENSAGTDFFSPLSRVFLCLRRTTKESENCDIGLFSQRNDVVSLKETVHLSDMFIESHNGLDTLTFI